MVSVQSPLELRGPLLRDGVGSYYLRNVTAGVFAGDSYHINVTAEAGSTVRIGSTSASKVHTMPRDGSASSVARLVAEPDSTLVWGPHPTILQAASDYRQSLDVVVLPGARVYLAEVLVFGRLARGEHCAFRRFASDLMIEDGLRVQFEERFVLEPGPPLDDALGGHGCLVSVYALGDLGADARPQLQAVVEGNHRAGVTHLPNRAGVLLRGLSDSLSAGMALAEAALAAAVPR